MKTVPAASLTSGWRNVLRILSSVVLACVFGTAGAQAKEDALHGADGIFVSPDAAIVWAVLKQPSGDKAAVWLRVVNANRKFRFVAVDGVDPFSKKRERLEAGRKLDVELRLSSDRDTFADLPSREIHFFRTEAELRANKAALTVYYLGVPDTTPEFSAVAAMDEYFRTVKLVSHKVEAKH